MYGKNRYLREVVRVTPRGDIKGMYCTPVVQPLYTQGAEHCNGFVALNMITNAGKASCEQLEETLEAFDVTPTGMTQIRVQNLKPLGAINRIHPELTSSPVPRAGRRGNGPGTDCLRMH